MTLVPIIYTSLLIFTTLLLLAIVVSYVSYRAKSRSKLPRSIEPIPNHRLVLASNTLPINNYVRNSITKQMQTGLPITINNNFSTKKHSIKGVENSKTDRQKLYSHEYFRRINEQDKDLKTNTASTSSQRNKTTQIIERRRLEIMNQNENFRTTGERRIYREDLPKQGPNLAEMNVLNYYSDNNEYDMVTLSASRVGNAI